LLANEKLN